ncbi:MAG: exodeoxyribonuclease VII large subunit [Candidatus Moraniibacteriota bacterium]
MSDQKLLYRLKIWRTQQAAREGVEPYRVLPNVTMEALATQKPLTKEEFFAVKGFKEAKWQRYGTMLLPMMADAVESEGVDVISGVAQADVPERNRRASSRNPLHASVRAHPPETPWFSMASVGENSIEKDDDTYTVSTFLNLLNDSFAGLRVRVRGEVSSVDFRDRTIYFSLKDGQDASLISCLVFRSQYEMCGVTLEEGQEIIIEGVPQIWKPTGRLSFKADTIELVGEGALQKAYNDLKKKLEQEGIFAPEKKRLLPQFPERIALITSRDGAAIGDFMMNLGRYGFKVTLYHSSVEGMRAVPDLMRALRQIKKKSEDYDALVMIRGGGSLESLQAFNNESLVRTVATFPLPVLAGIGHEKDVSLVALAADVMVSTPTATARALSESWSQAELRLSRYERELLDVFERALRENRQQVEQKSILLTQYFVQLQQRFAQVSRRFVQQVLSLQGVFLRKRQLLAQWNMSLVRIGVRSLEMTRQRVVRYERSLEQYHPERLLKLGYSLVYDASGRLVRSMKQSAIGDRLRVRLSDGEIDVEVKK